MKETRMGPGRLYERHEDMSPTGKLGVLLEGDGDLILYIVHTDEDRKRSSVSWDVEFCTIGSGGGRSPHTREAIRQLALAIEKDNAENPISKQALSVKFFDEGE